MRKLLIVVVAAGVALTAVGIARAREGRRALNAPKWQYPAIRDYGGIIPMPDAAVQPRKDLEYKVVFEVTEAPGRPGDVNPGLQHMARFLNVYASAGIPPQKVKLVGVVTGAATPAVLDSAHYRARFGVANPNLGLIDQLTRAGVKLYVCGQAMAGMGLDPAWLDPAVTRALSALTVVPTYELEGYALEKF